MKTLLMGALAALAPVSASAANTTLNNNAVNTVAVSDEKRFDGLYGGIEVGISDYAGTTDLERYFGLNVGYRKQTSGLVLGLEAGYGDQDSRGIFQATTVFDNMGTDYRLSTTANLGRNLDLRASVGTVFGRQGQGLLFLEGGVSRVKVNYTSSQWEAGTSSAGAELFDFNHSM